MSETTAKPSIPTSISIPAGATLSFPKRDEEFHMNGVVDVESYTIGKTPLIIPIIDTEDNSVWNGAGITIGNNLRVFRDWFRNSTTLSNNTSSTSKNGKKDILLWNKANPPGSELEIYRPVN